MLLKLLVVLLALGWIVQGSAGYCWEDVDVSLEFHQRHVFYFTSCYNGYYAGNYTVKAYQGNFDVEYGDQLCGTPYSDTTYFSYISEFYESGETHSNSWTFSSSYPSYYPKVSFYCRWFLGCEIRITSLCVDVYGDRLSLKAAAEERRGHPQPLKEARADVVKSEVVPPKVYNV